MVDFEPELREYPIYRGDDRERVAELSRALASAERVAEAAGQNPAARYGATDTDPKAAVEKARAAYNAFVDEVADRTPMVKYRHVGSRRFRQILLSHPARRVMQGEGEDATEVDHPDDAGYGVNTETFPWALLAYRDGDDGVRTIVEPDFASERDCLAFLEDVLSEGQLEELWVAAYMLNRGGSVHPKLLRLSGDTQGSSAT